MSLIFDTVKISSLLRLRGVISINKSQYSVSSLLIYANKIPHTLVTRSLYLLSSCQWFLRRERISILALGIFRQHFLQITFSYINLHILKLHTNWHFIQWVFIHFYFHICSFSYNENLYKYYLIHWLFCTYSLWYIYILKHLLFIYGIFI